MPQPELATVYFLVVGGFLLHPALMWIYTPLMYFVGYKEKNFRSRIAIFALSLVLAFMVLWPLNYISITSQDFTLLGWYIGILFNCGLMAISSWKRWDCRLLLDKLFLPLMFSTPIAGYYLALAVTPTI